VIYKTLKKAICLCVIIATFIFYYDFLCYSAIPDDDCLGCHEKFTGFNHGKANCNRCHNDITSLPHDERLKKPVCSTCHKTVEEDCKKGIHNFKKIKCMDCHNTHFLNKDKKTCIQCHNDVTHRKLPAKEKHLKAIDCLGCHGIAETGHINIQIDTGKKDIVKFKEIDRDGNNLIDYIEWDNLLSLINKELKEKAELKKYYEIKTKNPHTVNKRPASCNACHGEDGLFKHARLAVKGKKTMEIKVDPKIFIHELPSIEDYKKTIHGKKGVTCSDCHLSDRPVGDKVCIRCHEDIYNVYKKTVHAKEGATKCTDCHNPHKIKTYKELSTTDRVMVCARCHKDYIEKHKWLPHTVLHFKYLECSSCHSPESKKGMLFNFAEKDEKGTKALFYMDFEKIFGSKTDIAYLIDANSDNIISIDELISFVNNLRRKHDKEVVITSSIVVTEVHHDYSEKNLKSKVCSACHLIDAPFYKYMYIAIPQKDGKLFIPVKGTVLSAIPTSIFIDLCIIGETKINHEDIKAFLSADLKEKPRVLRELGFKLIDFMGITIIFFILAGIFVHILLRITVKK